MANYKQNAMNIEGIIWKNYQKVKETNPLVLNVTNYVVMNNTANALLAVGASPIMAHEVDELDELASISKALVLNIGTLDKSWMQSALTAQNAARRCKLPLVLDPVGVGASKFRGDSVKRLLANSSPTVIRGNASEIMALASVRAQVSGVDSKEEAVAALEAASMLADNLGSIIVISGVVDYVVSKTRVCEVRNGNSMMTKVTGLGCTSSALIGAFLGSTNDTFEAALSAVAIMGVAGELAARNANGPGSLQVAILDFLFKMDDEKYQSTINVISCR